MGQQHLPSCLQRLWAKGSGFAQDSPNVHAASVSLANSYIPDRGPCLDVGGDRRRDYHSHPWMSFAGTGNTAPIYFRAKQIISTF